ncbi:glycosyltransferase family 2 protein [Hydrotalea sandarakina]|jgi:GT2 family glycosyltransferase|uniref:GT2 family glycosyltransferase n=1 Tax=Hydrotalea sandarakina TaxID=1004304 RepID=A0A2W7S5M6_9BACT|nr:glycosyltransferase [Hydrotalea sandarakina]PZX62259.1 GT2 family glycosyltransferase [Hydrotalea sandarakina]
MNTTLTVSVVIPNYNTWELVQRNIEALLRYDEQRIAEIIVVDDASPLTNPYDFPEKVMVLRNPTNQHYTKTVNRGLKAAKGDIVVLLDSDAYPVQAFVKRLVDEYQAEPLLGCVGFKTVDAMGRDSGNFMTEPSIWSLVAGQQLHKYLAPYNVFRSKRLLPFSCAVSFRKSCLEAMNYFDENFRVLDADNDISMRIHRSNWKLRYNPAYVICHTGGNSIPRNGKRVQLFYESRWKLLEKHGKIKAKPLVAFLIMVRLWLEAKLIQLKKNKLKENFDDKYQTRLGLMRKFKKMAFKIIH